MKSASLGEAVKDGVWISKGANENHHDIEVASDAMRLRARTL